MPYISVDSGQLQLSAEISWANAIEFLGVFHEMESAKNVAEITVHVTSLGGKAMAGLAIAQAIRVCGKPVKTIGKGLVASAALPVLASGHSGLRSAVAGTVFMDHELTSSLSGTSSKQPNVTTWKAEVEAMAREADAGYRLLAEVTKKPESFWRDKLHERQDFYFTADQAVQLGIIDRVIALQQGSAI